MGQIKRNKRKEEKLQEQSHSLWTGPARQNKWQEKDYKKKGSRPTHIKKYSSFFFLSNWKLNKYFVGDYGYRIENYYYEEGERFDFYFKNLCNMERRGNLVLVLIGPYNPL